MSYILDALNRSEQERKSAKTPDLNTVHRAAPIAPKSNRSILWVGLMIIVLNGVGLAYFLYQPTESKPTASSVEPSVPTPAPEERSVTITAEPQSVQISRPSTSPTPQQINQRAVRITELPINVQRRVPNMVFSSHLYSDDQEFRMVNINGKMIREGDMVANDFRLIEITEEGVVLSYLHYVFEVSVLRDWSFN